MHAIGEAFYGCLHGWGPKEFWKEQGPNSGAFLLPAKWSFGSPSLTPCCWSSMSPTPMRLAAPFVPKNVRRGVAGRGRHLGWSRRTAPRDLRPVQERRSELRERQSWEICPRSTAGSTGWQHRVCVSSPLPQNSPEELTTTPPPEITFGTHWDRSGPQLWFPHARGNSTPHLDGLPPGHVFFCIYLYVIMLFFESFLSHGPPH